MNSFCDSLHKKFSSLTRIHFPFPIKTIPLNGIYILFEDGEKAHGGDRIVRIGTHTGNEQLPSRLEQHFLMENKDRSIFRKNIGRALLNQAHDPYIGYWELDLTTNEAREEFGNKIDIVRQKEIEKKVSAYIQTHFSFVVVHLEDKEKRLFYESRLISTISLCTDCSPSLNWLGLFSPKLKIRESGLWQEQELYKEPFSKAEFDSFIYVP